MARSDRRPFSIHVVFFLELLLLLAAAASVLSASAANNTMRPRNELRKYKRIRACLKSLNRPSLKTIQSPDGDVIDCVPFHLQPAFDHPRLKGLKPMVPETSSNISLSTPHRPYPDPPERPRGHEASVLADGEDSIQLWRTSGGTCPEGTVPIRRTKEEDILRASSVRRFGRKPAARTRRVSEGSGHEAVWLQHAVGYAVGYQYYGAKASLSVWAPRVASSSEFSLSQIWVISGSFSSDLNTIEAGWQVSPQLYGDSSPRFFTYWTTDAYQATGCYNLLCSGFIQTSNKIAIGAAISPTSTYNGRQFDISLLIWKDPSHGHWWLEFGSGVLVGYWPSSLFSHLGGHATMVQYGGEIFNTRPSGFHTATQMGSGHHAGEGFGRAAYFRNLQVVDWDNSLIPVTNLRVLADHPNCYDVQARINRAWGSYFYFGGPGRSVRCP
ncbi:protein neprosin isoform X1 [Musa acuminata AAA Group]|uniref:protein neprosin isoform X1 n=1 Tax=Musa acuminata AAA Group TaxID=214697 RepID=UPI0031D0FFD7